MEKTCNLNTVKNTPNEVRKDTSRAEFYYIKTVEDVKSDDGMKYETIQFMIDVIFDVLEYSDLSILDNAVVYGYHSDGTSQPLFMFKNDVINHHFTIIKISMVKKNSCI